MQIPAGLLLDRWGSMALITTGSVTMAIGQGLLAAATSLELVYLGRFVVGVGDSLVFVSVMALLPRWFSPRQVAVLTTVLGLVGGLELGLIRSTPPGETVHVPSLALREIGAALARVWRQPDTRLGFTHIWGRSSRAP